MMEDNSKYPETQRRFMKVNPPMVINDGMHEGAIIAVEYRDKPYEYTDIVIEFEEGKKVRAGFPSFISPTSKLGELLAAFGLDLEAMLGKEIDITESLIGKRCVFMTMTKRNKKTGKDYAEVVQGSVKLKKV